MGDLILVSVISVFVTYKLSRDLKPHWSAYVASVILNFAFFTLIIKMFQGMF